MKYCELQADAEDLVREAIDYRANPSILPDAERLVADTLSSLEFKIDQNAASIFANDEDLLNTTLCEFEISLTDETTMREIMIKAITAALYIDLINYTEERLEAAQYDIDCENGEEY